MSIFAALAHKVHDHWKKGLTVDRLGLEYLGGGCFGSAYLHETSGRVLKIGRSLSDGSMGYIGCVAAYCAKHGKPPEFAPMVYEFGVCEGFWFAVMERVHKEDAVDMYWSSDDLEDARKGIIRIVGAVTDMFDDAPTRDSNIVYWDLHSGNRGFSADGRKVVFDPFGSCTKVLKFPRRIQPKIQHGPSQGRWH